MPGIRVAGDEADLMIGDESSWGDKFCQFFFFFFFFLEFSFCLFFFFNFILFLKIT